jgi:hypothetical protein
MIMLSARKEVLQRLFNRVDLVGVADNRYALERHVPVYLCRGAKLGKLAQGWPRLKNWD